MCQMGLAYNTYSDTKLVNMYRVCDSLRNADLLFERVSKGHLFLWNVLISGYARNEPYEVALWLYYQILDHGLKVSLPTSLGSEMTRINGFGFVCEEFIDTYVLCLLKLMCVRCLMMDLCWIWILVFVLLLVLGCAYCGGLEIIKRESVRKDEGSLRNKKI
ncbi:PPR domain-containing protein [Cephalotus follicularis]|uniref:PPR domain-containing protein n=1 Tax=Cephalotus follicularis TaxID=3775 RepID=A0A1Q3BIJ6_CEPFO|nr:PPR domain-containing protein [Cephalotus follicularis]